MSSFKTNNFLKHWNLIDEELKSERDSDNIFIEYHQIDAISFGCRFSKRKTTKSSTRYDCSSCRSLIYNRKRKCTSESETGNHSSDQSNTPSYLYIKRRKQIEWKEPRHQDRCIELQSFSQAVCKSAKNEAVVAKSEYGFSSKQTYEAHLKMLLVETVEDVESSYKSFQQARSALDKAGKRVKVAASSSVLDENGNINKESTILRQTLSLNEEPDYFLIEEDESGLVVLGSKFLISKFFEADSVYGDGTFKIAPTGYTQVYILWYFVEATTDESDISQYKAIAAAYFIMKTKSKQEYRRAFDILEKYR